MSSEAAQDGIAAAAADDRLLVPVPVEAGALHTRNAPSTVQKQPPSHLLILTNSCSADQYTCQ